MRLDGTSSPYQLGMGGEGFRGMEDDEISHEPESHVPMRFVEHHYRIVKLGLINLGWVARLSHEKRLCD